MAIIPFDQRDGWIWFNGEIVPWKDAKVHVLTHGLHYGSSVFEGERAYDGVIFKIDRAFDPPAEIRRDHGFRDPLFGRGTERGQGQGRGAQRRRRPVCAPRRLARLRDDGGLRPAQQDPRGDRHLGLALDVRSRDQDEGHQARHRGLSQARPAMRAGSCQGRRPLHDLHHLQAQGGEEGLCRRHDAGLAGPRCRMHRRQHLLHARRRHPHADRRLLPQRHHPPDGDRARQGTGPRDHRAPDHAGGASELQRVLHRRLRGGGDAGGRDRPLHASSPATSAAP